MEYAAAYRKGWRYTQKFLISKGVPYDDALDITQEAWMKGWEHIAQLRNPKTISTWVNTIALNIHRTILRKQNNSHVEIFYDQPGPCPNYNDCIDAKLVFGMRKKADATILKEHYIMGKSSREIAEEYGVTISAVLIRLMKARRRAKRRLTLRNS